MTKESANPTDEQILFSAERVPVLQNRVYRSQDEARNAAHGSLEIRFDRDAIFGWNAKFEPEIIQYDESYDNAVPSQKFLDYYDSIADYLVNRYDLMSGPVIDIGCGKGTFLERLVSRHDGIAVIGVDPSYEGPARIAEGRLTFIAEEFREQHITTTPSLVLCRHTLEHVPEPTRFLRSILVPLLGKAQVPVFVEVPDLRWILINNAFWDFCYEHLNYFTPTSLAQCLQDAGAAVSCVTPAFEDQYLWAEGMVNADSADVFSEEADAATGKDIVMPSDYDTRIVEHVAKVFSRLAELRTSREVVVWGMATKGVMYSMHAMNHGITPDHCVDSNPRKQGRYCPLTAIKIEAPEELLQTSPGKRYAVICMNPNYSDEIRGQCAEIGLTADFYTADVSKI